MHDARRTRLNASEAVTRNSGSTATKLAGGIAISRTTTAGTGIRTAPDDLVVAACDGHVAPGGGQRLPSGLPGLVWVDGRFPLEVIGTVDFASALLSWLTEVAGTNVARRAGRVVFGTDRERALERVLRDAVATAVAEVAGRMDDGQAQHLTAVLLGHGGTAPDLQPSNANRLDEVVSEWIASISQPPGGAEYFATMGVEPAGLAGSVTQHLRDLIDQEARTSGLLEPIAASLFRRSASDHLDDLSDKLGEIDRTLARTLGADLRRVHSYDLPRTRDYPVHRIIVVTSTEAGYLAVSELLLSRSRSRPIVHAGVAHS